MTFKEAFAKYSVKYIIISIIVVIVLGALAFIIKMQYDISTRQDQIEKTVVETKQLADGIIRAQAKYVSKEDLEKFGKDLNLEEITDDLDSLGAQLIGISKFLVSSLGNHATNVPSSHTDPRPDDPDNPNQPVDPTKPGLTCESPTSPWCLSPSTSSYVLNSQVLDLTEQFNKYNVPIGHVTFDAWKDKPWSIDILARDYKVYSVLGEDKDGRHYMYHKFTISTNGKDYPIQIQNAEFVEEYPESSWEWWNPKISLGVSAGLSAPTSKEVRENVTGSVTPSIYFSPFSYGKTKVKPDFVFAQVGAGYDAINNTAEFSITPVSYNLGSEVNIINNTYIGPTIGVDTEGSVDVAATVSLTF